MESNVPWNCSTHCTSVNGYHLLGLLEPTAEDCGCAGRLPGETAWMRSRVFWGKVFISRKYSQSIRAPLDPHAPWKQLTPPSSTSDRAVNHVCRLSHTLEHHLHKTEKWKQGKWIKKTCGSCVLRNINRQPRREWLIGMSKGEAFQRKDLLEQFNYLQAHRKCGLL